MPQITLIAPLRDELFKLPSCHEGSLLWLNCDIAASVCQSAKTAATVTFKELLQKGVTRVHLLLEPKLAKANWNIHTL